MKTSALLSPALSSLGGKRGRRQWLPVEVAGYTPLCLVRPDQVIQKWCNTSCPATRWLWAMAWVIYTLALLTAPGNPKPKAQ